MSKTYEDYINDLSKLKKAINNLKEDKKVLKENPIIIHTYYEQEGLEGFSKLHNKTVDRRLEGKIRKQILSNIDNKITKIKGEIRRTTKKLKKSLNLLDNDK